MPDDPAEIFDRKYGSSPAVAEDPAAAFDAKYSSAEPDAPEKTGTEPADGPMPSFSDFRKNPGAVTDKAKDVVEGKTYPQRWTVSRRGSSLNMQTLSIEERIVKDRAELEALRKETKPPPAEATVLPPEPPDGQPARPAYGVQRLLDQSSAQHRNPWMGEPGKPLPLPIPDAMKHVGAYAHGVVAEGADQLGRMARGLVDVGNEGVKAVFGRGFDLGGNEDRPITGFADDINANLGVKTTNADADASIRRAGYGKALDLGREHGQKGAGLIGMLAASQPVAAGLARAGLVGPVNNVVSFAGGSLLTDPKHPVTAIVNGTLSGIGGELGTAAFKNAAAALLARWSGAAGERAVHVMRGLAFGGGMATAPHVDDQGAIHQAIVDGDWLSAAETFLLPGLLHAGASAESVILAAESLRADAKAALGPPKDNESLWVTLNRGRSRIADEQARAKAAAERGEVVAEAVRTGLMTPEEAYSPERAALVKGKTPEEAAAILARTPAKERKDGSVAGPTLPFDEALEKGVIDKSVEPLAIEASKTIEPVTSGKSADGVPLVVGKDRQTGEVVRVDGPAPSPGDIFEPPPAPPAPAAAPARPGKPPKSERGFVDAETGKPATVRGHRGEGATPEEVYGPENVAAGRGHPILGPGTYVAPSEADARPYAGAKGKVTKADLTLKNPLVLDSTRAWERLLDEADARTLSSRDPRESPGGVKGATERVQALLRSRGHDGVIVRVPQGSDVNARGESVKGLRETFGHDQAVQFAAPKAKATPKPAAKGTPEEIAKWRAEGAAKAKAEAAAREMGDRGLREAGIDPATLTPEQRQERLSAIADAGPEPQEGGRMSPAGPVETPAERAARIRATPEAPAAPREAPRAPVHALEGRKVEIPQPGGEPVPARYAAVERESLRPSHDPTQGYAPTPGYPTENRLQERDYRAMPAEQAKVEGIAARLNPAEMANTSPRATEGPPTVSPDGTVINGNGRAMALKAAGPEALARYREHLRSTAADYGIDPAKLAGMKDPVLVRVVDMDPRSPEAAEFGRRGNITATQAVDPLTRAARAADLIDRDILNNIAGDPDLTFSEAIVDPTKGRAFRRALEDATPANERPEFFKDDGTLTEAGKDHARKMLLVQAVGPDTAKILPPDLSRSVSDAAIQLAHLARDAQSQPYFDAFREAASLYRSALEGGKVSPADVWDQPSLIAPPEISPLGRILIDFLYRNRNAPKRMREGLTNLIEQRAGEGGMFGDEGLEVTAARALTEPSKEGGATGGIATDKGAKGNKGTDGNGNERLPLSMEPRPGMEGKKPVGPHEVIDAIADVVEKVGWGTGRLRTRNSRGEFLVRQESIRVREALNIPTSTHEMGHAFSKRNDVKKAISNYAIKRELIKLAHELCGNQRPAAGYTEEGVAELMRYYVTNPEAGLKKAPKAMAWFDGFMAGHPEAKERLLHARDLAQRYSDQGTDVRLQMGMVLGRAGPGAADHLREFVNARNQIEEFDVYKTWRDSLEVLLDRKLSPDEDVFEIASSLRMAGPSVVRGWVDGEGTTDIKHNITGESLKQALAPAAKIDRSLKSFGRYLWARHALDVHAKGMNPGMTKADAEWTVAHASPQFQLAADAFYKWRSRGLDYAVEAGLLTRADADRILAKWPHNVPLKRVFDEPTSFLGRMGKIATDPFKKFGGSGRRIRNPIATSIEQMNGIFLAASRYRVLRAIDRHSNVEGVGHLITDVPKEQIPHTVTLEKINKQLEDLGLDTEMADLTAKITYWADAFKPSGRDPIFPMPQEDGTTRWRQVPVGMFEALEGLDVYQLPRALKVSVGALARVFRMGTTGANATFSVIRNPLKDLPTFFMQTKGDPLTAASSYARAMGEVFRGTFGRGNHPFFDLYNRSGVAMANTLGVDSAQVRAATRALGHGRVWKVVRSPFEAVRTLIQAPEAIPRVAEMIQIARKVGWDGHSDLTEAQAIAIVNGGKRVTTDFTAAGKISRVLNQVIPFYNANIQGTRSMARAFKEDPKSATLRGLALITAPTLWSWWKHKDEDWYVDMPWHEKFGSWFVDPDPENKNGELIRIPRGYDWPNVFATLPEAIVDSYYRKDPTGFKKALGHVFTSTMPDMLNNPLVRVVKEQLQNKVDFTGIPIVPVDEEDDVPLEKQIGGKTTNVAAWLGKSLGWSPRRIDHAIQGTFGGLGDDVAGLLGRVHPPKQRGFELADIPIAGTLFRRGGKEGWGSQAIDDLYATKKALQQLGTDRTAAEDDRFDRLKDAARDLKELRLARDNDATTLAERQEIQRRMREVAREALKP